MTTQCAFYAPMQRIKTVGYQVQRNLQFSGPRGHRLRFAFIGEQPDRSSVCRLSAVGGPSAIRRLVVAVVIDAVNAVKGGWSWPHILPKRFKGLPPTLAHLYAAPTVVLEAVSAWVSASLRDAHPNLMLARPTQPVSTRPWVIALVAATRLGFTKLQVVNAEHLFLSAIAPAPIKDEAADYFQSRDHSPSGEPISDVKHRGCTRSTRVTNYKSKLSRFGG